MKKIRLLIFTLSLLLFACSTASKVINPFYEEPSDLAISGEANDDAINPKKNKTNDARKALESMGTYQQAHMAQPYNPVMRPAIVRLMWIPDHLNSHGDLIPSHYYYLKVLPEGWVLQDAFELESQLNATSGGSSNVPYIYK